MDEATAIPQSPTLRNGDDHVLTPPHDDCCQPQRRPRGPNDRLQLRSEDRCRTCLQFRRLRLRAGTVERRGRNAQDLSAWHLGGLRDQGGILVATSLDDCPTFAIAYTNDGSKGLLLSKEGWHFVERKTFPFTLTIDGRTFSGTFQAIIGKTSAFAGFDKEIMPAIYHGQNATITIGAYTAACRCQTPPR